MRKNGRNQHLFSMKNKEISKLNNIFQTYQDFEHNIEFFYANKHLDEILLNLKGKKVLEVGCSIGIMTRRLANLKLDLTVIDGSKKIIDYVKNLGNTGKVNFIISLFENFETKEKFDDIIMANLLEHVKNPTFILKKARSLLEEGGIIHIIVPNAESLHRRIGQKMGILKELVDFSEGDKKLGHRRVYTEELLENDIKSAGLKIIKSEGIFLKPFSDSQMEKFDGKILDALFEVGKELPDYCSTLYLICKK